MTQHFIEKKRQTLNFKYYSYISLASNNYTSNVEYLVECIYFKVYSSCLFYRKWMYLCFVCLKVCEYILCVLQSINVSCLFYRYARVEVPLHIVPSSGLGKACLESLIELPKILCQEEEEEYKKATADPELDLITKLQNSSGILHSLFCMSQVLEVRKVTPLLESHWPRVFDSPLPVYKISGWVSGIVLKHLWQFVPRENTLK